MPEVHQFPQTLFVRCSQECASVACRSGVEGGEDWPEKKPGVEGGWAVRVVNGEAH